jgi:myosin I
MDVIFDFKGDPIGGKLINYLLEKSRVVYQQEGERNFHSFYNLIYGASDQELKEYSLKSSDITKYKYLNQGGSSLNLIGDDKQSFRVVNESMKTSNFDPSLIKAIWSIIASIIHLGNLQFESSEKDLNNNVDKNMNGQAKISDHSINEIKIISKLLKIDEAELKKALTTRLIASGSKELVTKTHSVKEAFYARDGFAKVKKNSFTLSSFTSL